MFIESYSFGLIRIDGMDYRKDVIVLGDEILSPWWREAGGHVFAPEDLQVLISAAPPVVCLGTGYWGKVKVEQSTLEALTNVGSKVFVERTPAAVDEFNRISRSGDDVAAALHLTC